ncbi:hypothetical protein GGR20_000574 [Devosia subaequoris]|uniref:Mannosylglycerate hydrolase MGH1-like glycoside hydrolase domain-containing protein n=1 Tax=Devosia subaequoris TaxID=395930 RepID=A0A7W6IJU0_9HYPH|nr:hypothetical protein [Devosia subaequoris]MBB4050956.1 hypothetical protein [Devosia subaequoris]MCP1208375.1 hypothetical protein [Devosia subaequoris]
MSHQLLDRLRAVDVAEKTGPLAKPANAALLEEWQRSGVRFVSSADRLTDRYYDAVRELFDCIAPAADETPILHEGGIYHGCWLESTGTINAELLSRFLPSVTTATYSAFARYQRDDGLFPYKVTPQGPAFNQIQLVTPLARSVWNHFRLNRLDTGWLTEMFGAMSRYDAWLARHRDTLGTGAVEAFSTYDTGHDLSSRFWHVPDSPFANDPTRYDPDNPILPFVAPDLTANVACQRDYLGAIADHLGGDGNDWRQKAEASRNALVAQCHDPDDAYFYDSDRHGRMVRIQSDNLLRVLACEIGDADGFANALERYLLNSRKFFAKFPLTSVALDDPRFDPNFGQNSWDGPTNFLTLIRTPHAFEHHGHHVELSWIMQPTLSALFAADRFPQTLNPFTGAAGFTEKYSPSILCLLDYIERLSGILPRPEGELWFTSLLPKPATHRYEQWETAYGRSVDGGEFELVNTPESSEVYRDGNRLGSFPSGIRVVTDRAGSLLGIVGLTSRTVSGEIEWEGASRRFEIGPNERQTPTGRGFERSAGPKMVLPSYT